MTKSIQMKIAFWVRECLFRRCFILTYLAGKRQGNLVMWRC